MMNNDKWIEELKVGDVVFVSGRYGSPPSRTKVVRLTRARVMVEWGRSLTGAIHEMEFRKKDGFKVGADSWGQTCLIQATPEVEDKHELRKAIGMSVAKLEHLVLALVSDETAKLTITEAREVSTFCDAMLERINVRSLAEKRQ